jgi:hypothetical protein
MKHDHLQLVHCQMASEIHNELHQVIYELETLTCMELTTNECPSVSSLLLLGRRLAPSTIPPLFLRFNGDSGPLEALPGRMHVPFPTVEDLRFSILNLRPTIKMVVQPPPPAEKEEDEYADDF